MTAQPPPRVLVVDDNDLLRAALQAALRPREVTFVDPAQPDAAWRTAHHDGPWDLLVAGPGATRPEALPTVRGVRGAIPTTGMMVAVNGHDDIDMTAVRQLDPDRVVTGPLGPAELSSAAQQAMNAAAQRQPVRRPAAWSQTPPKLGTVMTIGGPTGGSGKTTVAINLAHLLHASGAGKVAVLDLDLQFSEVSVALQLRPAHTIYSLLYDERGRAHGGTELAEGLPDSLVTAASGFSVLAAPRDPAQADAIGAEEVARVLNALRAQMDYVVVDTPTGLRAETLAALDVSQQIVCVTQIDVPGLYNLRTYLETLERLGTRRDKVTVVLNKDLAETGVTGADAVQILGPVEGILPFSPAVSRALNEGKPVCVSDPNAPVSRALVGALSKLLPAGAPAAPATAASKPRWWQFWRRNK